MYDSELRSRIASDLGIVDYSQRTTPELLVQHQRYILNKQGLDLLDPVGEVNNAREVFDILNTGRLSLATVGDLSTAALDSRYGRKWIVDVKVDHGAIGNGIADDTVAFTNAIATAAQHVYVPPGTYIVNGLTMNQINQTMIFSPGATLKAKTGGSQILVTFTAAGTGLVAMGPNVVIDGNNVGVPAGANLYINNAADVTIDGLRFINSIGVGIAGQGTHSTIRKNTFLNCGSHSISVQPVTSATDVLVTIIKDNYISSTTLTGYGIVVHGKTPGQSINSHITDNHIILSGAAAGGICIEVWGLSHRSVISNNSTLGGIMGISVSTSDGTTVTGNVIYGAGSIGIECATSTFVTITGNTIDGSAVTVTPISLSGATGNNTVTGNTIRNYLTTGSGRGIVVNGQVDISIVGNIISGLQTIYAKDSNGLTVVGNNLKGATVGLDGVALENCLDCNVSGNIADGFSRSAVFVFTGAMTNIVVGPNIMRGGTPVEIGGVGNLGAGSRLIRGGTAPAGVLAISVTASPFTYTNVDKSVQAVYISGGTVSIIAKNSVNIFTTTDKTVWLEPAESLTVTYSVAPTMTKDRK